MEKMQLPLQQGGTVFRSLPQSDQVFIQGNTKLDAASCEVWGLSCAARKACSLHVFTLGFCFSHSLVKWQSKLLLKKLAQKQNSASSHQVNPSAFTSTPPIILFSCPGNALFVSTVCVSPVMDHQPVQDWLIDKFDSCLQVSTDTSSKNCKQTPASQVSG